MNYVILDLVCVAAGVASYLVLRRLLPQRNWFVLPQRIAGAFAVGGLMTALDGEAEP